MDKRIRAARGEEWKAWTPQNAAYNIRLHPKRVDQPRHWAKPRMVFVNSMSDLFHPLVPFTFIDEVMNVIVGTTKHTYQVLTKRPERMLEYFTKGYLGQRYASERIYNLWIGVSVENQQTADARIPLLLETPAAVRFLSCEPLLGEIDLTSISLMQPRNIQVFGGLVSYSSQLDALTGMVSNNGLGGVILTNYKSRVDWVICGGESGPNFRPMNLDWARSLRDQCLAAKVPFFYKQGSAFRSEHDTLLDGVEWHQFPDREELG